jgi:tight adherence protein C
MSDTVLLLAAGFSTFVAVSLAVWAVIGGSRSDNAVARSLAQVELMSARLAAPGMEQPAFTDRVVGPGLQRMMRLGRRFSARGVASRIQHHLDLAGNPPNWSVERIFGLKGIGLLIGLAIGLLLGLGGGALRVMLFCGVLGAAGLFLPDVLTWNAGLKRQEQIGKTLPEALDMLTVSVEAGLGFDAALSQVSKNTEGPLAGEFFRVLQEMQIGKTRAEAFRAMAERTTVQDLRRFVSSLVQADMLGIPIANVLREQAREMRLKRRARAEEKAQKIPIKILFPMIFFIFPALFVVIIGPGVITVIRAFSG